MRILVVICTLLFLMSGCTTNTEMIHEDFVKTEVLVNVSIYKNRKELIKDIQRRFPDVQPRIEGLAVWFLNGKTNECNIYVPKPKSMNDLNTWGHELAHCVYGSWHD